MPVKAANSPSAKRKLELEDDLSLQGKSSDGKRFRIKDSEQKASRTREEKRGVQKFEIVDLEEVQAQTFLEDKSTGALQSGMNEAKLSGRSNVRRSKRIQSSFPDRSLRSIRRWSEDQEKCLLNAILDTLTPQGEFDREAFYQRAKEQLRVEVSNSTLYEKMRSIKKKFFSREGKLNKQTAHEQTLFLMCEKLWGTMKAANLMESGKLNPEEEEIGSSSLNVIEAENPNLLKPKILNRNSAENSTSSEEKTLNPDSAKNLKNRENGVVNTSFGEISESRGNSALNVVNVESRFDSATNLESKFNSTKNPDSEVNVNSGANPEHMNKAQQSLPEEPQRKDIDPNLTVRPEHTENIAKGFVREETHGENTHFLEVPIHQDTHVENTTLNGIFVGKSPRQEIHVKNAGKSGHASDGFELPHIQFRELESRIEELIENSIKGIETRLEVAIQNSAKSVVSAAVTANSHSLEGFCGKVRMGNDALSNVARTLKDLMHGINSVEEFPSLDIGEACQMQQQWRKIKVQQLKTFSEGLELLANQCKLLMRGIET